MNRVILILITILVVVPYAGISESKVFMKRDEALETAFPGTNNIEKKQVYLSEEDVRKIEQISESKLDSRLYIIYKAVQENETASYAIIDTHSLRTKTETVMYVINPDGTLRHAEILAFFEPPDYMAGDNWIDLYDGKKSGEPLKVGKEIPNITGATITAHSFAQSVRRILAVFQTALDSGQLN